MNIAMISTYDNLGGAAIAAHRLFQGLNLLKMDPAMLVRFKVTGDKRVHIINAGSVENKIHQDILLLVEKLAILENRTDLSKTLFSLPYIGFDVSQTKWIREADIINLHWVAKTQSTEGVSALLDLGKPVVWTLHDQNPFTGGCHYTSGCINYQTDCRVCPQLIDNKYKIPFNTLKGKIKHWKGNLTIVTPSKWLAECAKNSRLFKNLRVEVIPNSLETDIFKPKAKDKAKEELGLDPKSMYLLFGAFSSTEKRKGFHQLVDAMRYCLQNSKFQEAARAGAVKILTFGPPQEELGEFDIQVESIGYVDENKKLATVYSAADIFVLPSLEDNLPNTMLEAMACGTPVLSFELGGMPDMIINGVTGFMAPPFDLKKLSEIILNITSDPSQLIQMNLNCRQLIKEKFNLKDQAKNYLALYEDLLKGRKIKPKRSATKGKVTFLEVQKDMFALYSKAALELINIKYAELEIIRSDYMASEKDRADRLEVIKQLQAKYQESEKDRAARLDVIKQLQAKYQESEKDRADRLEVIHKQAAEFSEIQQKCQNTEEELIALQEKLTMQTQEFNEMLSEEDAQIGELQKIYREAEKNCAQQKEINVRQAEEFNGMLMENEVLIKELQKKYQNREKAFTALQEKLTLQTEEFNVMLSEEDAQIGELQKKYREAEKSFTEQKKKIVRQAEEFNEKLKEKEALIKDLQQKYQASEIDRGVKQATLEKQAQEFNSKTQKVRQINGELEIKNNMILKLRKSYSYKLGRMITAGPRFLIRAKRKIKSIKNRPKMKLAFIDHSFHQQSTATFFLMDLLKEHFDVKIFWDESWRGGAHTNLETISQQGYDTIVLFQQINIPEELLKPVTDKNLIIIPMFDASGGMPDQFWDRYKNAKVINFSKTLHTKLLRLGLNSKYFKYFPSPTKFLPSWSMSNSLSGFFWQRTNQITWIQIKKLIKKSDFNKIHIHVAVDPPGYPLIHPSDEEKTRYQITISEWFPQKEDYMKILNNTNVYFAPRIYEGIGMSFLEAMAKGICVVAPDQPTMNEYIIHGKTGFLYNPKNPQPLDFSNIGKICTNSRSYIEKGYAGWLHARREMIDFIRKPVQEVALYKRLLYKVRRVLKNRVKKHLPAVAKVLTRKKR